jgi:hypothetical protein
MTRETVGRKREQHLHGNKVASQPGHRAIAKGEKAKVEKDGLAVMDTYLPAGSTERKVAGVGAAVVGALLAAAILGVGPAALAGAAGYVVYHEAAAK